MYVFWGRLRRICVSLHVLNIGDCFRRLHVIGLILRLWLLLLLNGGFPLICDYIILSFSSFIILIVSFPLLLLLLFFVIYLLLFLQDTFTIIAITFVFHTFFTFFLPILFISVPFLDQLFLLFFWLWPCPHFYECNIGMIVLIIVTILVII